jgi:hypothetical protein
VIAGSKYATVTGFMSQPRQPWVSFTPAAAIVPPGSRYCAARGRATFESRMWWVKKQRIRHACLELRESIAVTALLLWLTNFVPS